MNYLDNKTVIYIEDNDGKRRFWNRKTQGFSIRVHNGGFYECGDASVSPYFKGFNKHHQSLNMWLRLAENDDNLSYNRSTVANLKRKGILA